MGQAAGEGSDFAVVTSDNPRSEDPMAIINEILPGIDATGVRYTVEPDRARAISLAIGEAWPETLCSLPARAMKKNRF